MSETDKALFGVDIFGDAATPESRGAVADNFVAAPFTVLDARQGWWQDRKRAWINMGIKSEEGRPGVKTCMPPGGVSLSQHYKDKEAAKNGGNLLLGEGAANNDFYRQKTAKEAELGRKLSVKDFTPMYVQESAADTGTSIFDPVICELAYRWFCPVGGTIIDPFAGGSVRGIVAAELGFDYWGNDLREEQILANRAQGETICAFNAPTWECGDSLSANPPQADFLFSCPPYGDLEVYSDKAEDLSNMGYIDFLAAYRAIIARFCKQLRHDRFAAWVVGEIRDPKSGLYRDFVGDTVQAFLDAGLGFYNEAILVTMVGSASLRVTRQFDAGRKLCKTHQQFLVFVKGDWKKAADACVNKPTK
jgi:hypothetical protein